jgi:C-terminal of NADH-ubiquinone oxidoreductase 21 kDa subunit
MDMKEMVEKVKKGEPLYGASDLNENHQGVAARNSRYSALLAHIVPWANLVNHNQVSRNLVGRFPITDEAVAWCRHCEVLPTS